MTSLAELSYGQCQKCDADHSQFYMQHKMSLYWNNTTGNAIATNKLYLDL